uniref:ZapG family protein n=1 Tax=Thaumasiovibrio occultus TaxID=1891184 RepID=UPI000B35481C|nr:DUF1043 family protein [Thaumasiovibrio occultus]
MNWINALPFFFAGLVLGILVTKLLTKKSKQQKELENDLKSAKAELDQYRQELGDHFVHSEKLMSNIIKDCKKLYTQMAKTNNELLPNVPVQDNTFTLLENENAAAKKEQKAETAQDEMTAEQPKDYSNGSSGLLSGKSSLPPQPVEEKAN